MEFSAGSYAASTSGTVLNGSGSFTTDASGDLASLLFQVDQNGSDSVGTTRFASFMTGLNNIWFATIPSGAALGAVNPPTISNTTIAAVAPVPLPATVWMLLSGVGALAIGRRRR